MADATTAHIAAVTHELDKVQSVGQARAAGLAALAEIRRARKRVPDLPGGVVDFFAGIVGEVTGSYTEANLYRELNGLEDQLTRETNQLPGGKDFEGKKVEGTVWGPMRRTIDRIYITCAGLYGALGELATWNAAAEIGRAIGNFPGVLFNEYIPGTIKKAGKAAGNILQATGEGLGEAGKGLGKGLGFSLGGLWWLVILVVVGGLIYFYGQKKLLAAVTP